MRWMAVGLILALQAAACGAAAACEGQAGSVIFEDTFADDSGGWDTSAVVKPPNLVMTLGKTQVVQIENLTFEATFADYCIDFVLPTSPAPDNTVTAGIILWAQNYDNYYLVMVASNGNVGLYKKSAAVFTTVVQATSPAFKAEPDAVNSLRVLASKDGKLTISLNGTPVKAIRAQAPQGALRFGLMGQVDKPIDTNIDVRVKAYKVTAGN